jgi:ABC-2 type transport system ATP-binding protein
MTVTGTEDVLQSVLSALNGAGIRYTALRVEQPSLDDAFVSLTGRAGRTATPTDERSS